MALKYIQNSIGFGKGGFLSSINFKIVVMKKKERRKRKSEEKERRRREKSKGCSGESRGGTPPLFLDQT